MTITVLSLALAGCSTGSGDESRPTVSIDSTQPEAISTSAPTTTASVGYSPELTLALTRCLEITGPALIPNAMLDAVSGGTTSLQEASDVCSDALRIIQSESIRVSHGLALAELNTALIDAYLFALFCSCFEEVDAKPLAEAITAFHTEADNDPSLEK